MANSKHSRRLQFRLRTLLVLVSIVAVGTAVYLQWGRGPYAAHRAKQPVWSNAFRRILEQADEEPVRLPPRSPNLNSHLERFHLSLKSECLDKRIIFGERSLRNACCEFLAHYHQERNHQGLDNTIFEPSEEAGAITGKIERRERLGGLLNYYHRQAA